MYRIGLAACLSGCGMRERVRGDVHLRQTSACLLSFDGLQGVNVQSAGTFFGHVRIYQRIEGPDVSRNMAYGAGVSNSTTTGMWSEIRAGMTWHS